MSKRESNLLIYSKRDPFISVCISTITRKKKLEQLPCIVSWYRATEHVVYIEKVM